MSKPAREVEFEVLGKEKRASDDPFIAAVARLMDDVFVIPGTKIRFGYTYSDLFNDIPPLNFGSTNSPKFTKQYQSFAGVTMTQPLLKNFGPDPTLGNIRLAALDSDIAS